MRDCARSKNERQSERDLLRQKIAEVETLRSAYAELEKQIKQTISFLNACLEATNDGLLVIVKKDRIVSYNKKSWSCGGSPLRSLSEPAPGGRFSKNDNGALMCRGNLERRGGRNHTPAPYCYE
jgi:hypothetical protein